MHCNACILLTESELLEHPSVSSVRSSLKTHSVEVTGDFGAATPDDIAQKLSTLLEKHGYHLSTKKTIVTNIYLFFSSKKID
jgi:copper chaperone CopZ